MEIHSNLLRPAYGILPPGFPSFNPDLIGLHYDPSLGAQLLSESAYADPFARPQIVVTIPTGSPSLADVEAIVDMWLDVLGVEAEIEQIDFGSLYLKIVIVWWYRGVR